jgi:hypothetical protein
MGGNNLRRYPMIGQYVEVTRISDHGFVYLDNKDVLFCNTTWGQDIWCVEYKRSGYTQRLGVSTFKEAIEIYQERTGNCLIGVLDVIDIEHILTEKLSWMIINRKAA